MDRRGCVARPQAGRTCETATMDLVSLSSPVATPRAAAVARSSGWILARETWRFFLAIVATSLLGKALSEQAFGFITLVASIYAFGQVAMDHGLGTIVTRDVSRDPSLERPLLAQAMGYRVGAGVVVGLAVLAYAVVRKTGAEQAWLIGVAATFPLLAPSILGVVFLVRQDLGPVSAISSFTQLLFLVIAWVGLAVGIPPASFACLHMVRETLGPWMLGAWASLRHGIGPACAWPAAQLRGTLSATSSQAVTTLAITASTHIGVILVESLAAPGALGAYGAAFRLTNPFSLLVASMSQPLLPALASAWHKDRPKFDLLIRRALGLGLLAGIGGVLVTSLCGRLVVEWLYGGKYLAPGGDAASVMAYAGVAFGAICVGAPATTALVAIGREKSLMYLVLFALLANIGVAWWLIPSVGPRGAAMGLMVAELLTAVVACVTLLSAMKEREDT